MAPGAIAVNARNPNAEVPGTEAVQLIASHQRDIYFYVRSLVLDPEEVADIVQDTNLVLWEKHDQFQGIKNFRAWAFQIARYKVLEHRAQGKRRCLCFSDTLIDQLAIQAPQYIAGGNDELLNRLDRCVMELVSRDRDILGQRYSSLLSCESIAKSISRPVGWVYKALNRIRQELHDCMTRRADAEREP
jgi:RNA polymerase sigma-70 factor, ECF subfamily